MNWFLAVRVVRNRAARKLWLCQDSYVETIARKFDQWNGKTLPKTPMVTDDLTPYDKQATPQEIHKYQQQIGSLNYAAIVSRPDIVRTTQKLAEFLTNPSPEHRDAAEYCNAYLQGTRFLALQFGPVTETPLFQASSDASYADDKETRRSTEGYLFLLFGGPIDWRSTKQTTVTTSTTEAELLSLSHAATQLYWWIRFFDEIKLDLDEDYILNCDNLQTVRLMLKESPKLVTKLRHIDIHQHWLRQEVEKKTLDIKWVSTTEMQADGFTKALPRQKHEAFVRHLRMVNIDYLLQNQR